MIKIMLAVLVLLASLLLHSLLFGQQPVSDEAKRYFDRGMAAVEMAKSAKDYEDAIKEFDQAVRLAPSWPDAYYNLGLVQSKAERLDDALKNFKTYLRLAPNASDAEQVKQQINKIEYKKEKADKSQNLIKALTSPGYLSWVSGEQQPAWPNNYRMNNGKLEAEVSLSNGKHWIPVNFDGKYLKSEFTWYHCDDARLNNCPSKVSTTAEIVSASPLRIKCKAVWAMQYGDQGVREEEFVLERR